MHDPGSCSRKGSSHPIQECHAQVHHLGVSGGVTTSRMARHAQAAGLGVARSNSLDTVAGGTAYYSCPHRCKTARHARAWVTPVPVTRRSHRQMIDAPCESRTTHREWCLSRLREDSNTAFGRAQDHKSKGKGQEAKVKSDNSAPLGG